MCFMPRSCELRYSLLRRLPPGQGPATLSAKNFPRAFGAPRATKFMSAKVLRCAAPLWVQAPVRAFA